MSADEGVWMVRVSREYQHRVRVAAAEEGLGISEWFERVIDQYLQMRDDYEAAAEYAVEALERPMRVKRARDESTFAP